MVPVCMLDCEHCCVAPVAWDVVVLCLEQGCVSEGSTYLRHIHQGLHNRHAGLGTGQHWGSAVFNRCDGRSSTGSV